MPRCSLPFVVSALHAAAAGLVAAALAGCAAIPDAVSVGDRTVAAFTPNDFNGTSMYTRHIGASQQRTCEAARRALLSQGYVVQAASHELVTARKYYQPNPDTHYTVEMRVVCAPEGSQDEGASAFATAVQDRYVIKKVNNSASLGVGGVGSLSLPFSATEDTLVKVGSETISDANFYAGFFELFERYVHVLPSSGRGAAARRPLQEREAVLPQAQAD